jgi:hypothetical protein
MTFNFEHNTIIDYRTFKQSLAFFRTDVLTHNHADFSWHLSNYFNLTLSQFQKLKRIEQDGHLAFYKMLADQEVPSNFLTFVGGSMNQNQEPAHIVSNLIKYFKMRSRY